jgi:predicted secreted protein
LQGASELFSFRALISENELKQLMQLNEMYSCGVDFMTATDEDIKGLIKKVTFDEAPESNLVIKKSNVKRDKGPFSKFKDATAVLTRDKYVFHNLNTLATSTCSI